MSNLQLLSPRDNITKGKQRKKPSQLPPGVFRSSHYYRAQVGIDGKLIHLGVFDDPEQAHQCYLEFINES